MALRAENCGGKSYFSCMRIIAIKADSRVGGLHHEAVGRDLERRH